ncbi:FUSC family protein [Rahnella sp. SAP-1]|uniref:FUSC family protein n=1 Tax=Rouxiella aceris TaxID=2703884 RepID=A0A848MFD3_9GAMM|nr:FUSC family protein [Rouxiella aceris]NMP27018.1 FUSC family protein [Rouxiella aceris]
MKWLTKNAFLFSVKTCVAAFLALYIALELNLDKPAWSLTSVYVISQLYSASTLSKSVFRFLGTVLGGIFIFLIYPLTVMDPLLFSGCVSLWVAFCLYLSLHDRTPKNYVFMLAGYSAAIMGFADVDTPQAITYTVISRIEEITVAIVCSTLMHMIFFPVHMSNLLENSVHNWFDSAKKLCRELLVAQAKEQSGDREHVLVDMANYPINVEALITHCVYEGDSARKLIRMVSAQYQHLSYLIPTLTAIEKRLLLLNEHGVIFPDFIAQAFSHFLSWLNHADPHHPSEPLQQELIAAQEMLKTRYMQGDISAEEGLILTGLVERLQNFIRIAQAYLGVRDRVQALTPEDQRGKAMLIKKHADQGLMLLSSVTIFLVMMICCLFWIGSGWKHGSSAPMMAAIACSFFATHDSPIASLWLFLKAVIIAIAASLIYTVILIPMTLTFESLIICLAPGLIALGLVISNPATNLIGLIIATQIPSFMGMSHDFRPDLLAVVNVAISTIVGIVLAVVITAIVRNKRPSWTAKRVLRTGIKDLLQFTLAIKMNKASLLSRQQYVANMLDKVNIILPRNKVDPLANVALGGNLITEIWLGVSVYDFYVRHAEVLNRHQLAADVLLFEINNFIKKRLKNIYTPPPASLLAELNLLLIKLEKECRHNGDLFMPLFYLFNIRLWLYSGERWPRLLSPEQKISG